MSFSTSTHDIYGGSSHSDSDLRNNNASKNEAIEFPLTAEELEEQEEEEEKKNIEETQKKLQHSSHTFEKFVLIGNENNLSAADGFKKFTDSVIAL